MQTNKLSKRQLMILQYRQRLKFQSLGLPIPIHKKHTNQQIIQKMINTSACLHKENKQQIQETQFQETIHHSLETIQYSHNKLFLYFQSKVNSPTEDDSIRKSLSEAIVKLCFSRQNSSKNNKTAEIKPGDIMTKIYEETDKKCEIKKHKANKICSEIQKLYRQSHEYYMQLMKANTLNPQNPDEKDFSKTDTFSSSAKSSISQDLKVLTNKIQFIKKQISTKQNQYQHIRDSQKHLQQEKTTFIKLLLKNGFQRTDGITWILSILAQNNINLNENDLKDDLAEKFKKFILLQYKAIAQELQQVEIKNKMRRQTLFKSIRTKQKQKQKQNSKSYSNINTPRSLMSISQTKSRQQIYYETQNYIGDWVRKQKWKHQSPKKNTNVLQISHFKTARTEELKKLKNSMARHEFQKAMNYIYGNSKFANESRIESLSIGISFPGVRKQSYNSNCSHSFGASDDLVNSQTDFNSKSSHTTLKRQNTGRE